MGITLVLVGTVGAAVGLALVPDASGGAVGGIALVPRAGGGAAGATPQVDRHGGKGSGTVCMMPPETLNSLERLDQSKGEAPVAPKNVYTKSS